MKKILSTINEASTKPVEGVDSMSKFLRVVKEADMNQPPKGVNFARDYLEKAASGAPGRWMISANDAKAALDWLAANPNYKPPAPAAKPVAAEPTQTLDQYYQSNPNVREGLNESNNRLSMAEQLAVRHYQKDITNPVLNKEKDAKPSMIGKYFKQVEEELAESEQRYKDRAKQLAERVINKMHEAANPAQQAAIAISMKKAGKKPKNIKENIANLKKLRDQISEQIAQLEEFYNPPTDSKSPISGAHHPDCKCSEVEEGLRDPKDNPCWKGYKPVGTKQKNGRTVPNCVPK